MASGESLGKRVGRAAKTEPARPKPITVDDVLEDPEPDPEPLPLPDPVEVTKAQSYKDESEWMQVAVRWSPETRALAVLDFIRERGLFGELAKYAKKRMRR